MSESSFQNLRAVEQAIDSLLSQNKPWFGGRAKYGVVAKSISANGHELVVEIIFKSGLRYCCMEVGCHLSLYSTRHWERWHRAFREFGADVLRPLTIQIETVVEPGALFSNLGDNPGEFGAVPSSQTLRHVHEFFEADCE